MNRSSKLMFLFIISAISFETNCGREGSSGEISAANARENKKVKHASNLLKTFYVVNKQTGDVKRLFGQPPEQYFNNPNVVITNNAKEADRIAKESSNRSESPCSFMDKIKNDENNLDLFRTQQLEQAQKRAAEKKANKKQKKEEQEKLAFLLACEALNLKK